MGYDNMFMIEQWRLMLGPPIYNDNIAKMPTPFIGVVLLWVDHS